ncbi:hypothetical protein [Marinobacter salicampi]|uniref:hypothetical protein n=1 Tax=Marinobacter salicampi TaxID=435907 RepID=UPI001407B2EB|nr:hypothetical protein [Marinobacter salicampi]
MDEQPLTRPASARAVSSIGFPGKALVGLGIAVVQLALSSCGTVDTLSQAVPQITDVYDPGSVTLPQTSPLQLTAVYKMGTWNTAQTEKLFGFSRVQTINGQVVAPTRGPGASLVTNLTCQSIAQNSERCTVTLWGLSSGSFRFQWFLERLDAPASDDNLIEAPMPYGEIELVRNAAAPPPPPCNPMPCPPPPPVPVPPIELFDPEDGETCAGLPTQAGSGSTTVPLRWVWQGDEIVTARPGDYQVMVEKIGGEDCASLDPDSSGPLAGLLDIDHPDAAVFNEFCKVVRHNLNDTAVLLTAGESHQWRVRRIENAAANPAQFGPWTPWWSFTVRTEACGNP